MVKKTQYVLQQEMATSLPEKRKYQRPQGRVRTHTRCPLAVTWSEEGNNLPPVETPQFLQGHHNQKEYEPPQLHLVHLVWMHFRPFARATKITCWTAPFSRFVPSSERAAPLAARGAFELVATSWPRLIPWRMQLWPADHPRKHARVRCRRAQCVR